MCPRCAPSTGVFSLSVVVRNGCPSFVGQLNKFAILSDHKASIVFEIVYDHAWLDADDASLDRIDALAWWNPRVLADAFVQVLLDRLHRRTLKDSCSAS